MVRRTGRDRQDSLRRGPPRRRSVRTGESLHHERRGHERCFIPAGAKIEFGSISPLTNGHGDSNMGGHLGPTLKFAGYDMVIMSGISPKPVYLFIDDDKVELRDASSIGAWGHWNASR